MWQHDLGQMQGYQGVSCKGEPNLYSFNLKNQSSLDEVLLVLTFGVADKGFMKMEMQILKYICIVKYR